MFDGNTTANSLIAAMDEETAWAVSGASERIYLAVHHRLESANRPISHVYFIESGVASIFTRASGNLRIETGLVGNEGMVGMSLLSGLNQSPYEVVVQMEGSAQRVPLKEMQCLIDARPALQDLLTRYMQCLNVQFAGTALANGRMTIVERVARWLLMCHDRVGKPRLRLTHDSLSNMLGNRRAGVTTALHILEGEGLVRSERGVCTIKDRTGLEARAGPIYGLPEAEYRRLIGQEAQLERTLFSHMDELALIRNHLDAGERHIIRAKQHVARQVEIVKRLEKGGHDTRRARDLLTTFDKILNSYAAVCERLVQEESRALRGLAAKR